MKSSVCSSKPHWNLNQSLTSWNHGLLHPCKILTNIITSSKAKLVLSIHVKKIITLRKTMSCRQCCHSIRHSAQIPAFGVGASCLRPYARPCLGLSASFCVGGSPQRVLFSTKQSQKSSAAGASIGGVFSNLNIGPELFTDFADTSDDVQPRDFQNVTVTGKKNSGDQLGGVTVNEFTAGRRTSAGISFE